MPRPFGPGFKGKLPFGLGFVLYFPLLVLKGIDFTTEIFVVLYIFSRGLQQMGFVLGVPSMSILNPGILLSRKWLKRMGSQSLDSWLGFKGKPKRRTEGSSWGGPLNKRQAHDYSDTFDLVLDFLPKGAVP